MRLTTLILIVTMMQVSAGTFAQKISLSEKNVSLDKVFKKISQQSGYDFLIKGSTLTGIKPITINLKNVELTDVLNIICKNQPIQYKIENKKIIISQVSESFFDRISTFLAAITISGTVVDENGSPLAGTNIRIAGTDKATLADKNGAFSISVPNDDSKLIFSFIGFATQEVKVKQNMVVTMHMGFSKLDETVIVGYGSTKRKDLTGSVASVNMDEVKDVPFASFDQALTGKASGVQVVQSDGSPGGVAKIRIRGGTSLLGGNDPLYVIDGVQVQVQNNYLTSAADVVSPVERAGADNASGTVSGSFARALNSLGGLNINDIASIDILKDASATAIYGSKGANGVVIITTKKGKYDQKSTLEANYYTSVSVAQREKVLNRDQYIMIIKEGAANLNAARIKAGQAADGVAASILTDPNFFENGNTDWMNLVLRSGITQNADVSLRGGGEGSRYYTSLSYNKNQGAVRGTDFTKIAGKISLDNDITKQFRISTNLDYAFLGNNISNGVYTQAMYAPPTMNPYNSDGSIRVISPASLGAYAYQGFQNPLFLLQGKNQTSTVSLIGSIAAEYDILKELKFRSSFAVNYNTYNQNNYVPSTVSIATASGAGSSGNGIATQGQSRNVNLFYENTITWDKQFNKDNRLTVVAGTSWQINKTRAFTASGQGFPDDTYLNNLSSAAVTLPATGVSGQNSLLSFYGRANYSLFDKYLFTFTGRSDASSKFPANNRVGYFPSGGVAWRISQEKFLKNITWIDEIKLRASIGYTGTQNIADNLFYTLYSPVSYAGLNGLSPSQLGNNDLKWESTLQKDAGIDIELFKSRLRVGVGYYNKVTSGILFPTTVANSSGSTTVTANIATIRNRGLEFEISGDIVRKKNFQWSGSLNISGNRSKVLALPTNIGNPLDPSMYIYGNTVLKVGEPLGLLYGKVFDGIIQNQQELDAYKLISSRANTLPYTGIGDARFKGDGIPISPGSTQSNYLNAVVGHAEPRFYGGYTNTLTYKDFSLATLATFSEGGDIYYLADIQNMDLSSRTNKGVRILDRWTPDNPSITRPRLVLGQNSLANASSANVYKASYLKIKSVSLSYQLPKNFLNKLKISRAYLYASATNLFTFTKYPGADPEVSNNPYSLIGGYSDSGGYPTVRQYSFGLRIGL